MVCKRIVSETGNCGLCGKEYVKYESNKAWNHCLPCIQIITHHGFYDTTGTLQITKKGLEKLNGNKKI